MKIVVGNSGVKFFAVEFFVVFEINHVQETPINCLNQKFDMLEFNLWHEFTFCTLSNLQSLMI